MIRSDILIGGAFVLLGAFLVVVAIPIEPLRHIPFGPGLFPTIVGVGMVLFGAEVAWSGRRSRDAVSTPSPADEAAENGPALEVSPIVATIAFLIAPVLFIALVPWLGFLIAMPLIIGGLIGILWRRWIASAVAGVAITLLMQILFQGVLRVPLPWGLLEPWAGSLIWM